MRYRELKESYFPEDDMYHQASITDSRKTKLTLKLQQQATDRVNN